MVGVAEWAGMGCEGCGRVYSAILRMGGASWLRQIARDTGMGHRTVKRHLGHLMEMDLVKRIGSGKVYLVGLKETAHVMQRGEGTHARPLMPRRVFQEATR